MTDIYLKCPECGRDFTAAGTQGGGTSSCPECGKIVLVPMPGIEEGMQIGDFIVEKKLGAGAMGEVWLAHQVSMERKVALKILSPTLSKNESFISRFRQEVITAGKLHHQNIVMAYIAGVQEEINYLAIEYIDGIELGDKLKEEGKLSEKEALKIIRGLAEGLKYAWDKFSILHRDIKPSNVMIDNEGKPRLMDMGISKSLDQDMGLTMTGMSVGTPYYMSPEQGKGQKDIDFRSDLYSLGATLYHLVTGDVPFDGETAMAIFYKHAQEPLPEPREINPELSKQCSRLLHIMMAKTPEERQGSWDELIADIDLVLAGKTPKTKRPGTGKTMIGTAVDIGKQTVEKGNNKKWWIAGIIAAVVAIVAGVTFLPKNDNQSKVTPPDNSQNSGKKADPEDNKPEKPWTPSQISTVAWYDAADKKTITAHNGKVSKWEDKSGNGNDAIQMNVAQQPTYTASDPMVNNKPSIGSITSNGQIGLITPPFGAKHIYVVTYYKDGKETVFGNYATLLSGPPGSHSTYHGMYRVMGNASNHAFYGHGLFNNSGSFKNGSTRSSITHILPLPETQFKFKSSDIRKQVYSLGFNQYDTDRDWQGAYSEWIFTDGSEDEATEKKIEGYLAWKWGLVDKLPEEHPYKKQAPVVGLKTPKPPETSIPKAQKNTPEPNDKSMTPVELHKALKAVNPDYLMDGNFTVKNGKIVGVGLYGKKISNLSPLRGLPLKNIDICVTQVINLKDLEGMPLEKLRAGRTKISDLSPLKGIPIKHLNVSENPILEDLSPLKGLPLTYLTLRCNSKISNLSPLRGLPLNKLDFAGCKKVKSLKGLEGMPLTILDASSNGISDLAPLKGIPLKNLNLGRTKVNDLSPLKNMPLITLKLEFNPQINDFSPLLECKKLSSLWVDIENANLASLKKHPSLKTINKKPVAEFWKEWDKQQELHKALKNLNPDYKMDGKFKIENGEIVAVNFQNKKIKDISPLKGMYLEDVNLYGTEIRDLTSLKGMKIRSLNLQLAPVENLSPLKGMPLEHLSLWGNKSIHDLSPLKGMPLKRLCLFGCIKINDLSPLKDMLLNTLWLSGTHINSLDPLKGMPLEVLKLDLCKKIKDCSPLLECKKLKSLTVEMDAGNLGSLKKHPSLKTINGKNVAEFWLEWDAKHGQTDSKKDMTPEELHKALKAVNPNYKMDGKFTVIEGKIIIGHLRETNIDDISPLKGLALKELNLYGTKTNDLTPIKGMKLTRLIMGFTQIEDLSPLIGMPLEILLLSNTKVKDLSVLRGMPLKSLIMDSTLVDNLAPLENMRLTKLIMDGCPKIKDVKLVSSLKELECLTIPSEARNIDSLRGLPKLQKLGTKGGGTMKGREKLKAPADFWKEWDAKYGNKNRLTDQNEESLEEFTKMQEENKDKMRFNILFYSDQQKFREAKRELQKLINAMSKIDQDLYKEKVKEMTDWANKMDKHLDIASKVWKTLSDSGNSLEGIKIEPKSGTLGQITSIKKGKINCITFTRKKISVPVLDLRQKDLKKLLNKITEILPKEKDTAFHFLFSAGYFQLAQEYLPEDWKSEFEKSSQIYFCKRLKEIYKIQDKRRRKRITMDLYRKVGKDAYLETMKSLQK
jgi:serine/threonine protein kinase/DNA-directed RNA polymerase subunit RPC12/RpoP